MNIPNAITMLRLAVTLVVFSCLELVIQVEARPPFGADRALGWWAFWLFLFAAITDVVDGYLARKLDQTSMFGRVFDPLADKILVCGTFIVLLRFDYLDDLCPTWFVTVLVARELLVTTLRGAAESVGVAFPADHFGKLKMFAQCATAAAMISVVAGSDVFFEVARWGMWVTLVATVGSAIGYLAKARAVLFRAG